MAVDRSLIENILGRPLRRVVVSAPGKRVDVPLFELASCPTIKVSEIPKHRAKFQKKLVVENERPYGKSV